MTGSRRGWRALAVLGRRVLCTGSVRVADCTISMAGITTVVVAVTMTTCDRGVPAAVRD